MRIQLATMALLASAVAVAGTQSGQKPGPIEWTDYGATTPSNDFYGGGRPGANLYAESELCLDAATGKMKWYFQTTHHGLWDYDLGS